jgi:UTP--glucose-1-phosphate uridylyltransferase
MEHKVSKVIIPVAGFGTRFLPFTKAVPKELLPVINVPLINLIVEEALASGIKEIILVTSKFKQAIKNNFSINKQLKKQLKLNHKTGTYRKLVEKYDNVKFTYVYQKQQRGLGHAVLCAKSKIKNEPFAVMLGDELIYNEKNPVLKQCIDSFKECGNSILGVKNVAKEDVSKYGIVKLRDAEPNQKRIGVIDVVEKPKIKDAPSTCAILGRYIFKPEIFKYLENTKPSVGNEIQLTDAIKEMAKDSPFSVCYFDGERYDLGTKLGFLRANIDFALKDATLKNKLIDYLKKVV